MCLIAGDLVSPLAFHSNMVVQNLEEVSDLFRNSLRPDILHAAK
jgi:hypothetical protein